jgi:hypothetical protein
MNWRILKIVILFIAIIFIGYGAIVIYDNFFMGCCGTLGDESYLPEIESTIIQEEETKIKCQEYTESECPNDCIVCPPCEACSSLGCNSVEFCESIGFDKDWYEMVKIQRETVGWNIYQNETYSYEIKYPKDWNLSKNLYKDPAKGDWLREIQSKDRNIRFSIIVLDHIGDFNGMIEKIKDENNVICLAGHCSENPMVTYNEIELNNKKVFQRETLHNEFPGPAVKIDSYILGENQFYNLEYFHDSDYSINDTAPEWEITSEDYDLNSRILFSFRFLD